MRKLSETKAIALARAKVKLAVSAKQQGHITALLANAYNPITSRTGITHEDLQNLASVPELRSGTAACHELFKGHTAFDVETGTAANWVHDLAAILNIPVEAVFAPYLEYQSQLKFNEATIAISFKRTIGEHCASLGGRVSIADIALPLQSPEAIHPALHPRSDGGNNGRDNMIVLRGVEMTLEDAYAYFDRAFATVPHHDERTRPRFERAMKLRHGLDLTAADGDDRVHTVKEVGDKIRVNYGTVRLVLDHGYRYIRTRITLEAHPDADPKRFNKPKKKSAASGASTQADATISGDEFKRMLLEPDYHAAPKATASELIAEARQLRAELRIATEQQKHLGDVWNKNRNAETTQDFQQAIDTRFNLQDHLKELLLDLEKLRILPDASRQRGKTRSVKLDLLGR